MKPIKNYFRFLPFSLRIKVTVNGEVADVNVTRDAITINDEQTFLLGSCGIGMSNTRRQTIIEITDLGSGETVELQVSGSDAEKLVQKLQRYLQHFPEDSPM